MTHYLLDSGFLYASLDSTDVHHVAVTKASRMIRGNVLLPIPAITETAHFVGKNLGSRRLADFTFGLSESEFELISPATSDFVRSAEILRKYNDANIDFVDACIVAMAERLKITKILTVDRRHFSIFKPEHCDSFDILP